MVVQAAVVVAVMLKVVVVVLVVYSIRAIMFSTTMNTLSLLVLVVHPPH